MEFEVLLQHQRAAYVFLRQLLRFRGNLLDDNYETTARAALSNDGIIGLLRFSKMFLEHCDTVDYIAEFPVLGKSRISCNRGRTAHTVAANLLREVLRVVVNLHYESQNPFAKPIGDISQISYTQLIVCLERFWEQAEGRQDELEKLLIRMLNEKDILQAKIKQIQTQPPAIASGDSPKFLGLIVNEANKRIRRKGYETEVELKHSRILWHTFIVAYKAGEHGATNTAWKNGYPGDQDGKGPDAAKQRLKGKLQNIGLSLAEGAGVKIIDWDGK